MDLRQLTVIVPTKNERHNITAFLRSLPPFLPLIVVDASTDDTRELIRRIRPRHTVILFDPGNIARARQRGAEAAATEWLLFTDADVVFAENYFKRLAAFSPPSGCGGIVGAKASRGRYRGYYIFFRFCLRLFCFLGVPGASGSNMLVHRTTLMAAGGFDPELTCNEDSLLMWRIRRRGFATPYRNDLVVYETDHRRLDRGVAGKSLHSFFRCLLLFSGFLTAKQRTADWGYWKAGKKVKPEILRP